jgi:two-component system CheB/CheR fusion protein
MKDPRHDPGTRPPEDQTDVATEDDAATREILAHVEPICSLLQQRTGHNFVHYKRATVCRRIRRRIQALHLTSAKQYLDHLERDEGESAALLKDLLIGISQFFRDPDAFVALAEQALPAICSRSEASLRVWVPGCASGEEAYSLAIVVDECLRNLGIAKACQIFATDIDGDALHRARQGRYLEAALASVSEERRRRYFSVDGDELRVVPELREMCTFSIHDLLRDPPFSSLDLVSCRNVLIYLQPQGQNRVLELFHYGLRPGGILLLGPSEGLVASADLFEVMDKTQRIFRRKDTRSRPMVGVPHLYRFGAHGPPAATVPIGPTSTAPDGFSEAFARMLVEEYAPASAVVNKQGDVLFLAGRIGRYLNLGFAAPSHNILDQTTGLLRRELHACLGQAVEHKRRVIRHNLEVEISEGKLRLRLTVRPLRGVAREEELFAVVLEETEAPASIEGYAEDYQEDAGPEPAMVDQLERELRELRAELQSTVEQLESSNEELKASNEELQSANEELQSSQEELHSVNDELETVNRRLEAKVRELRTANDDLRNFFANAQIAILFVDRDLRITKLTPSANELFALHPGHVGRPITELLPRFTGTDLAADIDQVIAHGLAIEREAQDRDSGSWYILHVSPYRAGDQNESCVVVSFTDVTVLKRAQVEIARIASFPERNPSPIVEVDLQGRVTYLNPAAASQLPTLATQGPEHPWLYDFAELAESFAKDRDRSLTREIEIGGRHYQQSMYYLADLGCIRIYGLDVTEGKRAGRNLEQSEQRYRQLFENLTVGFGLHEMIYDEAGRAIDYRFLELNPAFERLTGLPRALAVGKTVKQIIPNIEQHWVDTYARVVETGQPIAYENYVAELQRYFDVWAFRPEPGKFATIFSDITARKKAEEILLRNEKLETVSVLAGGIAHDFNNLLSGLFGYLELAQVHAPPGSEIRKHLDSALTVFARSRALAQQLLTFAKGGTPIKEVADIRPVIHDALTFALSGANVKFVTDFPNDLHACSVDKHQIAQAIDNLAINARQAMPEGGSLFVTARNLAPSPARPGLAIEITLRDTGAGIPAQDLPRIFDPFFSTKSTGNGLGLASVRSIVERHGGRIDVSSVLGQGSTFRIELPASEQSSQAERAEAATRSSKTAARILVMDDESDVLRILTAVLSRLGHQAVCVREGAEAVACYREARRSAAPFDAVILDLTVRGGMGGREAATEILALDAEARLIVSSGYAEDPALADPGQFGFCARLVKPASIQEIKQVLTVALSSGE